MAKYKAYPKYKESGIDWIGDVPEGWELSEVKWLYNRKKITNNIEKELLSVYRDYGVIPKSSRSDNNNKESEDLTPYQLVEIGDLVTNKMKAWQGSIAISEYEGIVSPAYYVYKSCHNNHNKYLHYLFRSKPYILYYGVISKGIRVNQWDLEHEAFRLTQVVIPSLTEQQAIATFLDRETAHIDALIAKKESSIELLKEKRQATITHAVTKGLNPQAKMKDSDIEWIGEVPEGWEVKKIRYSFAFRRGLSITKADLQETGIPTISYGEIHSKYPFEISPEKNTLKCVPETFVPTNNSSLLFYGDFIFADTSEDLEGSGNFTYFNSNSKAFAGYHTIIASLLITANERFIAYLFDSQFFRKQIMDKVRGIKVFSITQEVLKSARILFPPLQEQQAIAHYLDAHCAKVDTLIHKTQRSIELLKEKRQALITAAVTGKIDVREAVC